MRGVAERSEGPPASSSAESVSDQPSRCGSGTGCCPCRPRQSFPRSGCCSVGGVVTCPRDFRRSMYRMLGFAVWDNFWFGGHPTLDYSIVMPVLAADVDPRHRSHRGRCRVGRVRSVAVRVWPQAAAVATLWFATANRDQLRGGAVYVRTGPRVRDDCGRSDATRSVGVAAYSGARHRMHQPGCGSLRGDRGRAWGIAKPPALAWCGRGPRRHPHADVAGVGAVPGGGVLPLRESRLAARRRSVRARLRGRGPCVPSAAGRRVLYALTCAVAWAVHSPLGGNVSRLGEYAAGPILAALWWHRRRARLAGGAPRALAVAPRGRRHDSGSGRSRGRGESLHTSARTSMPFYSTGRIEVPGFENHWESVYVAEQFPVRTWVGTATRLRLRAHLLQRCDYAGGVSRLARRQRGAVCRVGDVCLDSDSQAEAALLRHPQPYLEPVLTTAHWHVWRVVGYRGYVDGPARLVSIGTDRFTVAVSQWPAHVVVKIHYTPRWSTTDGVCVTKGPDNWTQIDATVPGSYTIRPAWFPSVARRVESVLGDVVERGQHDPTRGSWGRGAPNAALGPRSGGAHDGRWISTPCAAVARTRSGCSSPVRPRARSGFAGAVDPVGHRVDQRTPDTTPWKSGSTPSGARLVTRRERWSSCSVT